MSTKKTKTNIDISDTPDFKKFCEYGFKYTVESIIFLADHNKTMNDAIDFYGKADNIVYLVGAGIKDKTVDGALKVIAELMDFGICLEVIYCLCVNRARENGFFINDRGLQTLDAISTSMNLMENKTVLDVIVKVLNQYKKAESVEGNLI